jgi:capsular polysaccharide transport system permease protein
MREALTRLSKGRVAWLWLLLEPIAHVALMMMVFTVVRGRSLPGLEFATFLAVGVLGFGMFSTVALRSMEAISANAGLFAYRQVKPVDTVIVRTMLEGLLQLLVSVLLLAGAAFVGLSVRPVDILKILMAATVLWGFGAGTGLVLSVAARLLPEVAKVARMFFGPLHLLSGIFFAPFMLPPGLRPWFLLNPIPHGIESLRSAFLAGYPVTSGVDLGYLTAFAMGSVFFGLALHVRFARRLTQE